MSPLETPHPPADQRVRDSVAAADRRRRTAEATRQIWRAAPILACIGLLVAAAGRWAAWPAILPLPILAIGIAGLALYAYIRRRDRTMSDHLVARIDDDAAMKGELRSASWFATRDTRTDWADLHVERAAARLQSIDWRQLYPDSPTGRARLATALLVVATLALSVSLPFRSSSGVSGTGVVTAATRARTLANLGAVIPPELLKQLEELLSAADGASQANPPTPASAAELRDLLNRLSQLKDLKDLKALARAMDPSQRQNPEATAKQLKELAERAQRTSEMATVDPDVKKGLEKLAEKMSDAAAQEQQAGKEDPKNAQAAQEKSKGDTAQTTAGKGAEESSEIKSVKDAQAGGGSGVMMMAGKDGPMGGEPGTGLGGDSAPNKGNGTMADIELALRKETIEAASDNPGDNVLSEARRKTELGKANVTFTRGAAGTFDRSRAAAPPAVPEGRRTAVQTYFIRKQ